MMIGPAPMIRIEAMSVRLAMPDRLLVDEPDEALEEIMAVLRSGRGFGVILDREDRLAGHAQALVAAVEERHMGRRDIGGQALGLYPEAVILAGDLDLSGRQILDRMVGAAMALRHLGGTAAQCQRQQLMAETDAEDRHSGPDQLSDHRYGVAAGRGRIARAVREEHAVGPVAQDLFGG